MPEDGRNIAYRKGPAIIGTEDLAHEDASAFAKAGARAFFIGVVLVALQCWITPYIEQFINGTYLALDHLPKGPIIALFVLILTVNVLLLISRFGGAVKIGIFIGANAILIISYALSFAHQGKLPDEIGWWATHVLVYVGVNSLLLCVAWKGLPARAAGGLFFNASMHV